jgi:hypothetical protein
LATQFSATPPAMQRFFAPVASQSQYAKKAYETWVAEASKLGEMYVAVARDAYKPVEKVVKPKVQ